MYIRRLFFVCVGQLLAIMLVIKKTGAHVGGEESQVGLTLVYALMTGKVAL